MTRFDVVNGDESDPRNGLPTKSGSSGKEAIKGILVGLVMLWLLFLSVVFMIKAVKVLL